MKGLTMTSKKDFDYVGGEPNSESLNFSALGTFDSSDSAERNRDDIILKNSCHPATPRQGYDEGTETIVLEQERLRYAEGEANASRTLEISPLSSISNDDSGSDTQQDSRSDQMSIFRPKHSLEYRDSRNNPSRATINTSPSAGRTMQNSGYSYPVAARQVSVSENRSFKTRESFDSVGNFSQARRDGATFEEQNIRNLGSGPERRQDEGSVSREDVNSGYYDGLNYQSKRSSHNMLGRTDSKAKRDGQTSSATLFQRKQRKPKNINYLMILRPRASLFAEFTFLLPGLKMYVSEYLSNDKHKWGGYRTKYEDVMAKRRLVCTVQAYGGNMFRRSDSQHQNGVSSIFRVFEGSRSQADYDQLLNTRYYENDSHLSWDVEENPPVGSADSNSTANPGGLHSTSPKSEDEQGDKGKMQKGNTRLPVIIDNEDSIALVEGRDENSSGSKTRYRCKLCGQPKQNHTCPYEKALLRHMGTMSYPALNAFQCKESGNLAPALSDMNNFVDLENDIDDEYGDDLMTPEDCKSGDLISGISSLKKRSLDSIPAFDASPDETKELMAKRRKTRRIAKGAKSERYQGDDKLFHEAMDIRPEQHRIVSPNVTNQMGDFRYPTLPLSFEQRKNTSEDLFELSQQIVGLTEECAEVLRIARESNAWDLAVAELITQVLVIISCPLGDNVLNGLRRHLETLGISS